jgi:hypothetical protein
MYSAINGVGTQRDLSFGQLSTKITKEILDADGKIHPKYGKRFAFQLVGERDIKYLKEHSLKIDVSQMHGEKWSGIPREGIVIKVPYGDTFVPMTPTKKAKAIFFDIRPKNVFEDWLDALPNTMAILVNKLHRFDKKSARITGKYQEFRNRMTEQGFSFEPNAENNSFSSKEIASTFRKDKKYQEQINKILIRA